MYLIKFFHATLCKYCPKDYGFEYSDGEEGNDEADSVDVENMYYKAKCMWFLLNYWPFPTYFLCLAKKEEAPEDALKEFRAIINQEEEKGDWCGL